MRSPISLQHHIRIWSSRLLVWAKDSALLLGEAKRALVLLMLLEIKWFMALGYGLWRYGSCQFYTILAMRCFLCISKLCFGSPVLYISKKDDVCKICSCSFR